MKKIKKLLLLLTLTLSLSSVFPVYAAENSGIEMYSQDQIVYNIDSIMGFSNTAAGMLPKVTGLTLHG